MHELHYYESPIEIETKNGKETITCVEVNLGYVNGDIPVNYPLANGYYFGGLLIDDSNLALVVKHSKKDYFETKEDRMLVQTAKKYHKKDYAEIEKASIAKVPEFLEMFCKLHDVPIPTGKVEDRDWHHYPKWYTTEWYANN